MQFLVLWDIDGTLIYGGGVAGEALRAAMARSFGPTERPPFPYAGMTDHQILFETYPSRDRASLLAEIPAYTEIYLQELRARSDEYRRLGGVQPGIRELLARFQQDERIVQTLLTGNIRPAAEIKLGLFGLGDYVDFEIGAYGSDHHHRPELVPFAVRRAAERYGRVFQGHEVIVIGDTPNDILCGQTAGAFTIGVATGAYTVAQLREAGADAAFESLADIEKAASTIYGNAL